MHLRKLNKGFVLLAIALFALGGAIVPTAISQAHQVQTSGNVGGVLHIEPNDNPRARTSSRAWFALTRRGGQPIPLSACNCYHSRRGKPAAKPATAHVN